MQHMIGLVVSEIWPVKVKSRGAFIQRNMLYGNCEWWCCSESKCEKWNVAIKEFCCALRFSLANSAHIGRGLTVLQHFHVHFVFYPTCVVRNVKWIQKYVALVLDRSSNPLSIAAQIHTHVGVGNSRVNPRFHSTDVGWNLESTRKFPTLAHAEPGILHVISVICHLLPYMIKEK